MYLLGFAESEPQWRALAESLGADCAPVAVHRFPDHESRVCLPPQLPARIALYRSLDDPNPKLVELLLTAATARRLGVSHITLVAPYLCYMRQDMAFAPGQAISQQVIGQLLAAYFDAVVTVDPHLHRIRQLREAIPLEQAIALSASKVIGRHLAAQVDQPLLLGPDEESLQWTRDAAAENGLDYGVARKTRRGDREVQVALPERNFTGRNVVLVDDVVSSGHTLMAAARALHRAGAATVYAVVTHALFTTETAGALQAAGIAQVWSTDSVPHTSNAIPLRELLADALRALG